MTGAAILTADELATRPPRVPGRLAPARAAPTTTPAILDWERERIVRRDWVMVARVEDVADARQLHPRRRSTTSRSSSSAAGTTSSARFYNVCRHRGHRGRRGAVRQGRPLPVPVPRLDLRPRRASSSGPSTPRTSTTSASRRSGCARSASRRWQGFVFVSLDPDGARRSTDWLGDLVPHLARFDFGDPARRAQQIDLRGRRQLEVHRRELQRVLPLPGRPPAAQQADAVRPRRRLRPRRRRGRAAGWSSSTTPRRWPSTAATGHGRPAMSGITALDERRIYYYLALAARRSCRSTRTTCSSTGSCRSTPGHDPDHLRLAVRAGRRSRCRASTRPTPIDVLGPDQPPGLARVRAPAARARGRAAGSPAATRTRSRRVHAFDLMVVDRYAADGVESHADRPRALRHAAARRTSRCRRDAAPTAARRERRPNEREPATATRRHRAAVAARANARRRRDRTDQAARRSRLAVGHDPPPRARGTPPEPPGDQEGDRDDRHDDRRDRVDLRASRRT